MLYFIPYIVFYILQTISLAELSNSVRIIKKNKGVLMVKHINTVSLKGERKYTNIDIYFL